MNKRVENIRLRLIEFCIKYNIPVFSSSKGQKILETIVNVAFLKYLLIGFSTYGIDFLLYNLLDSLTSIQDINANIISTFGSLTFNFIMSNFWTFNTGGKNKLTRLKRYTVLVIANYIFGNLAFYFLYYQLHINDNLTKIITLGCIVSWNYFLYKFWVFK